MSELLISIPGLRARGRRPPKPFQYANPAPPPAPHGRLVVPLTLGTEHAPAPYEACAASHEAMDEHLIRSKFVREATYLKPCPLYEGHIHFRVG